MIEGRYFPPHSSRALRATLSGSFDTLELAVEGAERAVHVRVSAISDRLAGVPRKIAFPDGGVFETAHDADLGFLEVQNGGFLTFLSRIEGNYKAVIIATALCIAAIFGVYRYGLPIAAAGAAWATPQVVVDAIDYGTLETVDQTFFGETRLPETERTRITALFDTLLARAGPGVQAELLFRSGGPIGANAIALPGGTVIITDELAALAASDDEIAGVLAHEIGHIAGRHSLKQIYRVLGISFMIAVVGGDSSQLIGDVVTQASALQSLAYTREFEADADRYSVDLMVASRRNPVAFIDLLDRIVGTAKEEGDTDWFSTHPGNADRRAAVTRQAENLGWKKLQKNDETY